MRTPAVILALAAALACACRDKEALDPGDSGSAPADENLAYHHTEQLLSFGPRPPQSNALKRCRDYIAQVLTPEGWQVATQTFTAATPAGQMTFINVIARHAGDGEDPWQRPVTGVIGAHLDSKIMPPQMRFVGADDAASAVGAILSLATQLTPEEASAVELVFFDGEEAIGLDMGPRPDGLFDGLYGSRAYAQRWANTPEKPDWGYILDMIGHKDLAIRLPSDSPPHLARRLLAAAKAEGAEEVIKMGDSEVLDDHVPLNSAGIPAIDMIGDFQNSNWWHTDRDKLGLISRESLALSEAVALRFIRDLLANPPRAEIPTPPPPGDDD